MTPREMIDVRGCARCGGDHEGLLVKQFVRPIVDEDATWGSWATCPGTGDPILIAEVSAERAREIHMRRAGAEGDGR